MPATATARPTARNRATARVAPATVTAGASVRVTATLESAKDGSYLVDIEIYDSAGKRVYQRSWDNSVFTAGDQREFTATWSVPANQAAGTYTVKIGLFKPAWGSLVTWNDSAARITVNRR